MCQVTPLWVDLVSRETTLLWIISIEEWPAPMTLLDRTSVWHRLYSEEEATAVPQALRCPAVQSERVPPSGWNLLGREIGGNNICTFSRMPQNSKRDLEGLKFSPTEKFQCIQIAYVGSLRTIHPLQGKCIYELKSSEHLPQKTTSTIWLRFLWLKSPPKNTHAALSLEESGDFFQLA